MKETTVKRMHGSLVLGCVMMLGLCVIPAAHATDSQAGSSSSINTLIGILKACTWPNKNQQGICVPDKL